MKTIRRLLAGLAALAFLFLVVSLAGRGLARAEDEHTFSLPMDCGKTVCVVPARSLQLLLQSNEAWAKEAEQLRAELARFKKAADCRGA